MEIIAKLANANFKSKIWKNQFLTDSEFKIKAMIEVSLSCRVLRLFKNQILLIILGVGSKSTLSLLLTLQAQMGIPRINLLCIILIQMECTINTKKQFIVYAVFYSTMIMTKKLTALGLEEFLDGQIGLSIKVFLIVFPFLEMWITQKHFNFKEFYSNIKMPSKMLTLQDQQTFLKWFCMLGILQETTNSLKVESIQFFLSLQMGKLWTWNRLKN